MIKKIRKALKNSLRNNEKGFTLIELLVVVVILGILAAIVIPKVTGSAADAKKSADAANKAAIEAAAERYYIEEGKYPDTVEDLVYANYLKSEPENPITGNDYTIDPNDGEVN